MVMIDDLTKLEYMEQLEQSIGQITEYLHSLGPEASRIYKATIENHAIQGWAELTFTAASAIILLIVTGFSLVAIFSSDNDTIDGNLINTELEKRKNKTTQTKNEKSQRAFAELFVVAILLLITYFVISSLPRLIAWSFQPEGDFIKSILFK